MWYRTAQKQIRDSAACLDLARRLGSEGADYWEKNAIRSTTTPDVYLNFARTLTDRLIEEIQSDVDLKSKATTRGWGNLEHQIRTYALLSFRDLGLRFASMACDIRQSADPLAVRTAMKDFEDEVVEGADAVLAHVFGHQPNFTPAYVAPPKGVNDSPTHGEDAEEIDLADEGPRTGPRPVRKLF